MVAVLLSYPYERFFCSTGNAGSISTVRVTGATSTTSVTPATSAPERSSADQYRFR
jgi:hypothetical protein